MLIATSSIANIVFRSIVGGGVGASASVGNKVTDQLVNILNPHYMMVGRYISLTTRRFVLIWLVVLG